MPIFYFHPQNVVPRELAEMTRSKGFMYTHRGELDIKLERLIAEAGHDIWSTYHTVLGSLPKSVDQMIPLDPDDPLDAHTLKLCNSSKTPWSYIKVINGNKMSFVMGYCSTPANSPFALSNTQMAQKGIMPTTYIPVAQ